MNPKSLIPVLVVAGAIGFGYGLATFTSKAPSTTAETPATATNAAELVTTFVCVGEGGEWKTFAESESPNSNAVTRSKNPVFTWNSKEFGDSWTPDKRCREVTRRFTVAVAKNGGKLANLDLKTGKVNDETVACAVQSQSEVCNDRNMLFTMSQHNEATPQQTLAKLINFSQEGTPINESAPPSRIPLKSLVNLGISDVQKEW